MDDSTRPGLLDPIQVGTLSVPNRIVMPPMGIGKATASGEVTEDHIEHYVARAKARPGLIIVEFTWVEARGSPVSKALGIDTDDKIPGLRRLVSAVKETGTPVAIQIAHAGARVRYSASGQHPVGPSHIKPPRAVETPHVLTVDEIGGLVEKFADAAVRAAEAGFDAVELHGAHGYLLSQFVSPYTNQRQDDYGGSVEGRARFPLEIVAEVRRRLGAEYPLFYRLGVTDFMPGGLTLEEGTAIAALLVDAGVDLMDISAGITGDGKERTEQGYFVYLAEAVKRVVEAPVVGVGSITEPHFADQIVREGRVDMVAVGRAMLSNPNWAADAARRLRGR